MHVRGYIAVFLVLTPLVAGCPDTSCSEEADFCPLGSQCVEGQCLSCTEEDFCAEDDQCIDGRCVSCGGPTEGDRQLEDSEDIGGLEGSSMVVGSLTVSLTEMEDLDGLECLREITNDLVLTKNTSLSSLRGLKSLRTIGNSFVFESNDSATSLDGLGSLETVSYMQIEANLMLSTLEGLGSLENVEYNTVIANNPSLTTLALRTLASAGSLEITNNNSLVGLDLDSITTLGELTVYGNRSLESLEGLDTLEEVEGRIMLSDTELTDLGGLSALTSISGDLALEYNDSLVTLVHLRDNLTSVGGDLRIMYNTELPTCEADELVSWLESHGWTGEADIEGNDDDGSC